MACMPWRGARKTGPAAGAAPRPLAQAEQQAAGPGDARRRPAGAVAARLRWLGSPALTLPTSGSTRRSSTSAPKRCAMSAPEVVGSAWPRGTSGSSAARALPGQLSRRERASAADAGGHAEHEPVRAWGGARRPTTRRPARPPGDTRSSRPSSAARSTAQGTRARNASGPSSTAGRPANGVVRILPPRRCVGLEHRHLGRIRRPPAQLVGGGQAR